MMTTTKDQPYLRITAPTSLATAERVVGVLTLVGAFVVKLLVASWLTWLCIPAAAFAIVQIVRAAARRVDFYPDSIVVNGPLRQVTVDVEHITEIALSPPPKCVRIFTDDGGYVLLQVGRNVGEFAGEKSLRIAELQKLIELYTPRGIQVGEHEQQTKSGLTRRSPSVRTSWLQWHWVEFAVVVVVTYAAIAWVLI